MYLSTRASVVKNVSTAIVNGAITLVLLLIAPLGLAAVIGNTFLVTVASFFVGTFADIVVDWLKLSSNRHERFYPFQTARELHVNRTASAIKNQKD